MASTSKTPSRESLKNDEEEEIPSEERSLTDLKFKIKPFNKKRPIFDPEIMGVKKKRGGPLTPVRSNSSSNIQKGMGETRSKFSLWSSKKSNPKKETESEEDLSSSLNPVKNTLKGVERYMGCLSTRIKKGLYGGPSGPWKKQTRHVIPTKIVKQDFETIMTPEAKEIIETMRRLTRPIRKGAGWMSLREAESAPLPKPGSLHGPPVSWTSTNAWNKQKVGITNMDQLRENASETASTMSLPSSTSGGGGKVRAAKKTRERAPRAQPPSEEIESESCLESLASVPKLSFNPANFPRPVDCSTPQHKPKKVISSGNLNISRELKYDKPAVKANSQPVKSRNSKIPTAPREYIDPQDNSKPLLFSCPKYKESSSSSAESQTFDSQTSFSFSQPKKLNRLGLGDSQKKSQKDGKVSVKGYYEQKKKFLGSEEKKVEAKKEDVNEKPKSVPKKDPPKEESKPAESVAPAAGGFGDFMAKQKEASKNKWVCDICMMSNDASLAKCPACEAPNPKMAPPKPAETATPIPAPVAGGFADFMSKAKKATSGNWTCSICMMSNAADLAKCPACEAPNPNPPKVSSEAAPAAAAPKFSFGTSSAAPSSDAPKPSFTFGASSTTEKKEEKTAPPTFSFGAPSTTEKKNEKAAAPSFTFGAPKTEETKTATPSFSFGSKAEEPKKDAAAPSFSFGASAATPSTSAQSVLSSTAAPSFSFSGGSKLAEEPKPAAPSFSFGGAKAEEKKSDPAPTFSFGSAAKKEEAPKVAAPSFSFGGSTAPKTEAAPSFSFGGSSKPTESAKPAVSAAPTFSFGGGSSSSTTSAAPSFSFNAASKPAEPAKQESSAPSFSFGGSSKPTPPTTTASSFSLGGATSAAAEKPFTFGGASNTGTTQSKPAAPSFNFGGSSSTENKPFAFGGNTDKPASTTAAAPSFNFGGSQTNNSSKSTGSSLFGETQSSTNATPSFTFKGSSEPSSQSSMFGGASKPAPSFNFGGSSSTPSNDKPFSFGGSQPQAQEKPFSFGGASSQNTGSSSSMFSPEQPTKQASAPSFNFGGGGSQPSSQTNMFGGNSNSQSSGFNFGGDNKSTAPSGGNMFGNTSGGAAPAPTFNFGGAGSQNTSQNSSFNFGGNASQPAPAGNMFSAGAQPASNNGVAAPRRKIVRARRTKR